MKNKTYQTLLRSRYIRKLLAASIIYVIAGAIESSVYYEIFADGGHPDVPFSQFPGYLIWAPVAPILLGYYFVIDHDAVYGYSSLVFVFSCFGMILFKFLRREKRGQHP